ncbi:MAG TPA: hypothetical protein VMV71_00890 [Candidatus Paceibacterota bacterium]|nr:hypothetical protein [Candidatus Paceibacterota bacterium]
MKTHYYCGECDIFFYEEGDAPNINRVHNKCGLPVKIIKHIKKDESDEE